MSKPKKPKYKSKKGRNKLEASKVTFSHETRQKLMQPGLTRKHKAQLKKERVKAFIRSKPVGTPIRKGDLIAAAGYSSEMYQSGFGFIENMIKHGEILCEKIPRKMASLYTIPEDANVVKPGRQTIEEIRGEEEIKSPEEQGLPEATEDEVDAALRAEAEAAVKTLAEDAPERTTARQSDVFISVHNNSGPVDVELIRVIEGLAKDFTWSSQSDSLREFIRSLK